MARKTIPKMRQELAGERNWAWYMLEAMFGLLKAIEKFTGPTPNSRLLRSHMEGMRWTIDHAYHKKVAELDKTGVRSKTW